MAFYSYKMTRDYGFAPNPFFGLCTLATCKPNIRKAADINDWIIGTGGITRKLENRLIYLMNVTEKLTFEQYWSDNRFECKKPIPNGSLIQIHGDNIYYKGKNNEWYQLDSQHTHYDGSLNYTHLKTDLSGKYVLVSRDFYYFGKNHIQVPEGFENICCGSRDYFKPNDDLGEEFIYWIQCNYDNGILGDPIDWTDYDQLALIF